MAVEIDQSGKFEQLDTRTVIACANETASAIWIPTQVKRKLIQKLRKTLILRKDLVAVVFSVLVFLLLDTLDAIPTIIVIDEEYTGKDKIIKETLRKLIDRKTRKRWEGYIRFKQVGKLSSAHKLAWTIHRKKRFTGIKKIAEVDILRFLP